MLISFPHVTGVRGLLAGVLIIAAGCGGSTSDGPVSQGPVTATLEAAAVLSDFPGGFSGNPTPRGMVIPSLAATPNSPDLRDHLFILQTDGLVRVEQLPDNGAVVTSLNSFSLEAAGTFAAFTTTASGFSIESEEVAVATSSNSDGGQGQKVYFFDPRTADVGSPTVNQLDLTGFTAQLPAATNTSNGVAVTNVPVNFINDAVVVEAGGATRVFMVCSNFSEDATGVISFGAGGFGINFPGTVVFADLDVANLQATAPAATDVLVTTDFNPLAIEVVQTPGGPLLLVLNVGTSGNVGPASIDVINPATLTVVANIPLGATRPNGMVVTPDGTRVFVGGSDVVGGANRSELYLALILGLESELGNNATATLANLAIRDASDPILLDTGAVNTSFDDIPSLAVSPSGNYLYAVNFNAAQMYILEVTTGLLITQQGLLDLSRGNDPTAFQNNPQVVVVRPETAGVDFTGPDLYLGVINFQGLAGGSTTGIEAVTTGKH